jgi:hypothetical protein
MKKVSIILLLVCCLISCHRKMHVVQATSEIITAALFRVASGFVIWKDSTKYCIATGMCPYKTPHCGVSSLEVTRWM